MGKRIRDDSGLRDELRVARHYQTPLSVLRGRAVQPGEPLWTADDLDVAVAYEAWLLEEKSARCPSCGTRHDDWRDEQGRVRRDPPYVARTVDCDGCRALSDMRPDSKDEGVKGGWRRVELAPYDPPNPDDD